MDKLTLRNSCSALKRVKNSLKAAKINMLKGRVKMDFLMDIQLAGFMLDIDIQTSDAVVQIDP